MSCFSSMIWRLKLSFSFSLEDSKAGRDWWLEMECSEWFVHSPAYWLKMAVNWDLSWGFQLEYLLAGPPGAYVGFLTLWWLSFRSERPWRTRQMFYYLLWFRLRSYCHFCHSLKPVQIQGDGKSCQSCIVKRACGIGDPVVGIYEWGALP